jgi:YVTN family beta-propeller protein
VTAINGATNQPATINVGKYPFALAFNPATNRIYVANSVDNTVSVISGASNTVVATLSDPAASSPQSVAVDPLTNRIYVANLRSNNVSVFLDDGINPASLVVSLPVISGQSPVGVAVNPLTNKIYVANTVSSGGSYYVSAIDGVTNFVSSILIGSSSTGEAPYSVTVDPVNNKIYVPTSGGGTVAVIDGSSNTVYSVATGGNPYFAVVNPVTNKVYVSSYQGASNNMAVIADQPAVSVPLTVSIGAPTVSPTNNLVQSVIFSPKRHSQAPRPRSPASNTKSTLGKVHGRRLLHLVSLERFQA